MISKTVKQVQTRSSEAGSEAARKRIVIVGGGFGGIAAARALKHCDAEIILIDRRNHHIFQPLLYQVATAVLSPSEISAPIRQLSLLQENVNVILGEVTAVDKDLRSVTVLSPGTGESQIRFDYLIIASGTEPSYFGHNEFAEYAPGLKNLRDAEAIRTKILTAYELAETTADEIERSRQMTFVLVGGGPTGVELAASMAQLARITLRRQFRRIDPATSAIILIEGGGRILPTFDERLAVAAATRLERLGVRILTGAKVEKVDESGVIADGKRIPSATVVWTAGVAPSPILKQLGAKTDRGGRILAGPHMNVDEACEVFVVGDAAAVVTDNRPVPGVAPAAIQQGRHVGRLIARQLAGQGPPPPFRYHDRGNMAVVGRNFALLETRHIRTSGFITWLIWAFVHILSLPQLQNRVRVMTQWFWSYYTGQRSSRLIPEFPNREVVLVPNVASPQ
ncbi:MAG TPA: NAD(P)/FAD-dependent oxidoreductase [Rhizomicrobium sp.]|nr:NAD(P)/FAD-dependent oxidoreductase [Rhizomicrobium sp.]